MPRTSSTSLFESLEPRQLFSTFTVTNTDDSGAGSLRQAIVNANNAQGADVIEFDASLSGGSILLTTGHLAILDELTINGLGADKLSVNGNALSRVFLNESTATIRGLKIQNGRTTGRGGGVLNEGALLTLEDMVISNNVAFLDGGGIWNDSASELHLVRSTISANTAAGTANGGGIYNGFRMTIDHCEISGNHADAIGGGVFNVDTCTITDSLISDNSALSRAGGIRTGVTLNVIRCTISGNAAQDKGGGIAVFDGVLNMEDSSVVDNTSSGVGAGIYGAVAVNLSRSLIARNISQQPGGGIAILDGALTMTACTVRENTALYGGGVYLQSLTPQMIADSTIFRNVSHHDGGGIHNAGSPLTLINSTVGENDAFDLGGGIFNASTSRLLVENCTVSQNVAEANTQGPIGGGIYSDGDVKLVSTIVTANHLFFNDPNEIDGPNALDPTSINNLIRDAATAGGLVNGVNGNIVGVNPQIDNILRSNGGPTGTYSLRAASPARDHGLNPESLHLDQRGHGFPRVLGSDIDIGAFEYYADDYEGAGAWQAAAPIGIDPNSGNGSRAGEIGNNLDTDLFKFAAAGSGNATVILDVGAQFDGFFEVYDGAHNFILRQNTKGPGGDESHSLAVTANQTYFVLVGGWRTPGGSYTIKIDGPAAPDDHADANAWPDASVITIDPNSGNGSRSGSIEAAGDTDLFKFTAAASGTATIVLDVAINFDGVFEVYDGAHKFLLRQNTKGPGGDESRDFIVVANQPFFVLVSGWRAPGGGYIVKVDGPSAPDDHADGGAWQSASGIQIDPNSGNGSRAGSIEAAGDSDLFRFAAAGSGTATITLDVAFNFDGFFEVYDGAHKFLFRQSSKGPGGDEVHNLAVTANQSYFVLVAGWRTPGGGYILKVDGPSAPDDFADEGAWANAAPILLNGSGNGSRDGVIEAAGDTDLFRFTAPKSGTVSVHLDVGTGFDGWIEIYDASHHLVKPRANTKAAGGDESISFNTVVGQSYFVLVGGWRNPGGAYTLSVDA